MTCPAETLFVVSELIHLFPFDARTSIDIYIQLNGGVIDNDGNQKINSNSTKIIIDINNTIQ